MSRDVTLVILAAGIGKRFWPLTTDKNAFPFFGTRFFDYVLPQTLPPQVTRCVIVTNPSNRGMFSRVKLSVPVTVALQEKPDGMAGALLAAEKAIRGQRLIVTIADDLADPDRYARLLKAAKPDVFGVLTVWKPATYFPGGYVVFRDGRPVAIREKPGEGKTPSEYVYFGGQYIGNADDLMEAITSGPSGSDDIYEHALTALMKKYRFDTVAYEGDFVSLKYPWHVLDAMRYLFSYGFAPGRGKNVDIRNNVSVEGPVYLGNNVRVFENTKLIGPLYVGDNTVIGTNNLIRESIIGSGCVTGFNTDITRSYIGNDCWFHSNYIGDSVLEENVSLGSGSVLANLRLDEGDIYSDIRGVRVSAARNKLGAVIGKNVRIGVNASVMPGIKIGGGSMIGAAALIDRDIPDNSFVTVKSGLTVRPNTRSVAAGLREQFKKGIT